MSRTRQLIAGLLAAVAVAARTVEPVTGVCGTYSFALPSGSAALLRVG